VTEGALIHYTRTNVRRSAEYELLENQRTRVDVYRAIPVAKSSDRIGREIDGWQEAPERRSDGFASLAVKGRSHHPTWNESDETFGTDYNFAAVDLETLFCGDHGWRTLQ
jgi:hypothetical protein